MIRCTVDECDRSTKAEGMCEMHLYRWRRYGDTAPRRNSPYKSVSQRLWDRADCSGGEDSCWPWKGAVNNQGYGLAARPAQEGGTKKARKIYAHRYAWEEANGRRIPDGLYIDHICHTPRCINPKHLRLVTPAQNSQNLAGASKKSRTGHRNVYPHPSGSYVVQVRRKHIGTFASLDDAIAAAAKARRELMPYSEPTLPTEAAA